MSLALTIFLLVFVGQLISWIGQTVLQNIAYSMYQSIFNASTVKRQKALQNEILTTKKELLQTSAQDEFAKWAKLRRKVDKGLADLEKLNSELSSAQTSFSLTFKSVIWILTSGAQLAVGWWYRSQAVFYLPPGWLGPATRLFSLPFAPAGSVSCWAWQMACKRVINIGERIAKDFVVQVQGSAPVSAEKAGS
ncbi:hypothetical protein SISNIDRAFT_448894 [Sistotremastrum niveocremeum HHB9708]|uniref:Uncharacterized protein n=2 Tax=Sistotremastraceae TaxID=3402574 RepID=A0A165A8E5_9AGAM|nr:hypothetical protein SISNIDRAFT_448894 [Sistotremastrum niveocremeum HHB9708]KZT43452.1 hypothetical protein SISSUDRAFT_1039869 [Sistotremastrum suecicum HHB10207 ss-3]